MLVTGWFGMILSTLTCFLHKFTILDLLNLIVHLYLRLRELFLLFLALLDQRKGLWKCVLVHSESQPYLFDLLILISCLSKIVRWSLEHALQQGLVSLSELIDLQREQRQDIDVTVAYVRRQNILIVNLYIVCIDLHLVVLLWILKFSLI